MKTWEIKYVSFEGRNARMHVETEDDATEEDAMCKAIAEDAACGDGIHKIIDCEEV